MGTLTTRIDAQEPVMLLVAGAAVISALTAMQVWIFSAYVSGGIIENRLFFVAMHTHICALYFLIFGELRINRVNKVALVYPGIALLSLVMINAGHAMESSLFTYTGAFMLLGGICICSTLGLSRRLPLGALLGHIALQSLVLNLIMT